MEKTKSGSPARGVECRALKIDSAIGPHKFQSHRVQPARAKMALRSFSNEYHGEKKGDTRRQEMSLGGRVVPPFVIVR